MKRAITHVLMVVALLFSAGAALAAEKVTVLSTTFVLERKFKLLEEAARGQGVELAWVLVDRDGEAGVRKALEGSKLVIVDAPRTEDRTQIERVAGKALREAGTPTLNIIV